MDLERETVPDVTEGEYLAPSCAVRLSRISHPHAEEVARGLSADSTKGESTATAISDGKGQVVASVR